MRRLVFVLTVACAATFATGCIISSGDDGPPVNDTGAITADWSFHNADPAGGVGAALACPGGFSTAAVTATPTGGGTPVIDLYDCPALTGTADYPVDQYDVHIDITSGSGGTVYNAGSLLQTVDITTTDESVSEDFIDDGGRFALDWVLVDTGNAQVSCTQAGAVKIGLTGTLAGGGGPYADELPCGDATGISVPALSGTYTLTIQALDGTGAALGAGTTLTNKTIQEPNGYTDLGSVSVPFN